MNWTMKDNSAEVIAALKRAKKNGLEAVGMRAETHAKEKTPVDTGRLRNSMSHKVVGDDVYIGTNTSYAPYV